MVAGGPNGMMPAGKLRLRGVGVLVLEKDAECTCGRSGCTSAASR
ncbi:hypothetical protein [Micromonospora sp. DT31]